MGMREPLAGVVIDRERPSGDGIGTGTFPAAQACSYHGETASYAR
jgi:hypothetical protein